MVRYTSTVGLLPQAIVIPTHSPHPRVLVGVPRYCTTISYDEWVDSQARTQTYYRVVSTECTTIQSQYQYQYLAELTRPAPCAARLRPLLRAQCTDLHSRAQGGKSHTIRTCVPIGTPPASAGVPSTEHRVSSIEYRVARLKARGSRLQVRALQSNKPA